MLSRSDRDRFDAMLERVIDDLPPALRELLEEAPVIVEDQPDAHLLRELGMTPDQAGELCGLHSGIPMTEQSVSDDAELPTTMHLFRRGIIEHAGGWAATPDGDGSGGLQGGEAAIAEEIRITLLHEIGHHFGLDEDDLARLGYD